jgi:Na+/proline symporter
MQKQKKYWAKICSAISVVFFLALANAQLALGQWDKSKLDTTKLPKKALNDIISNFALWLLAIFGFIAVIGFVVSGILYLVSSGDEDAQERAKRAMIYSITGVLVGLAGLVVITAINYFLEATAT